MDTKLATAIARAIVCSTAIAGVQVAANATEDRSVTVAIHVSAEGLDLSQTADARTFYSRLKNAAWVACTRGNRAGLVPVDNVKGCCEKALGGAIHSAHAPLITQIYLATHTPQEAAVYGINAATQIAAVPPQ